MISVEEFKKKGSWKMSNEKTELAKEFVSNIQDERKKQRLRYKNRFREDKKRHESKEEMIARKK